MYLEITSDERFIIIRPDSSNELDQMKLSMTKELSNAWLLEKMDRGIQTKYCFLSEFGLIPIGLWSEVIKICRQFNYELRYSQEFISYINSFDLKKEEFYDYINDLFKDAYDEDGNEFIPYGYQIEAAWKLLKYKKCCAEISTSGGKTLISYIMFRYLLDVKDIKRILYIVPSVDLATQSVEKYESYESYLRPEKRAVWKPGILKGGLKAQQKRDAEDCNILFGTYHSLVKRKASFFKDFKCSILDECHHGKASSIKNILNKCYNLQYSFGVTGTFPKESTYDNYILQSLIGPVVYKLMSYDLINVEKKGTPLCIVFEIMDYATNEEKMILYSVRSTKDENDINAGTKALRKELEYVNSSKIRLGYIGDIAIRCKKNTLVLFGDVKSGYGKKLYEYIKERSNKNVYYCDGGTKNEHREYYKNKMEEDTTGNTILVASIGVMGEGIDVKNLWNILLVNSVKSDRLVRQICGRGLRRYPGKDKVVLFDFVDDLRYAPKTDPYKKDNYMWKHYKERIKIYNEQGFPTFTQKVKFENKLI